MAARALIFPDRPEAHRALTLDRPRLMGVLNATPDSFSDGGRFDAVDTAVAHGHAMAADGAAIIDVGGESTRPGAQRVGVEEQTRRVVPIIRALRERLDDDLPGVVISVDTTRAAVAEAALDAGASMLNDVSAGREDEGMLALAADRGVPIVLMHMRGEPATMQADPTYGDVVAEVTAFLDQRVAAAVGAGVAPGQALVDPGIGFGKTLTHNLALLQAMPEFVAHFAGDDTPPGPAVLLGSSRKSLFAKLDPDNPALADPANRLSGTLATTALAVAAGVPLLRVHDVPENAQAALVAYRITQAGWADP